MDTVFFCFIIGPEPVFHDEQRHLVPLIQQIQRIAQALGVDLPSPVAGLHVRVLSQIETVGDLHAVFHFHGTDGIAHVIAEPDVIHAAFL